MPGESIEGHPAIFPLEIPRRCIKMWTFVGETVLDPFVGSGTTLKACQELDRNGIGCENNESAFRSVIVSRIGQMKLF
jgi:site-specific DNA-methyltransferase (adenine-specific)